MAGTEPIDLKGLACSSLNERHSKVTTKLFGRPWTEGGTLKAWLNNLPRVLAAADLSDIAERVVKAFESRKTIILAMGAHPIKVGLNPFIIQLMEEGIISGLAMNGAGIIHDSEVAMVGKTSEDVAAELGEGSFGMAEETGRVLNSAIIQGAEKGQGMGESIGSALVREGFPFNHMSLLARAHELKIPATVHVAIGTDIIHCHPSADGASIGRASHLDFRIFSSLVSTLEQGVFINMGSAVILPEVFLKSLSLVRNLGHVVKEFTTVNMDFIKQYRPLTNVVSRPTLEGGKGFNLIGHHEIMFPLLAAAILEGIKENE